MDTITMIVGGVLGLMLTGFILLLAYSIAINLIKGRKFHHSLEQQVNKLRMSKMLVAVGINKTDYIYQTNVNNLQKQMRSCSACNNTDECDDKLSKPNIEMTDIAFCNNEAHLKKIKQQQSE